VGNGEGREINHSRREIGESTKSAEKARRKGSVGGEGGLRYRVLNRVAQGTGRKRINEKKRKDKTRVRGRVSRKTVYLKNRGGGQGKSGKKGTARQRRERREKGGFIDSRWKAGRSRAKQKGSG